MDRGGSWIAGSDSSGPVATFCSGGDQTGLGTLPADYAGLSASLSGSNSEVAIKLTFHGMSTTVAGLVELGFSRRGFDRAYPSNQG